jgi:hypothetical protein
MFTTRDILLGGLLPGTIAFIVALGGLLLNTRTIARPLAIGGGFFAGYFLLFRPKIPPLDAIDWLAFIAAAVVFLELLQMGGNRVSSAWGWVLRTGIVIGVALIATWLLARPLLQHAWEHPAGYVWIAGVTLSMTALWIVTNFVAGRIPAPAVFCALTLIFALSAVTAMLSASQKIGQIAGILTAATAGVAVASLIGSRDSRSTDRGGVLVPIVLFVGILACSSVHFYAEMTPTNSIVLLISPAAMLPAALPVVRRRGPIWQWLAAIGLALIPAGIATALAAIEFARATAESPPTGW